MIRERDELKGKIERAECAIGVRPYGMDEEDANYLNTQVGYMRQYLDVLERRITKAEGKNA